MDRPSLFHAVVLAWALPVGLFGTIADGVGAGGFCLALAVWAAVELAGDARALRAVR